MSQETLLYTPGLVSVVIPLYREVESVGDLVTSLEMSLKNLGHPYELILIDDGSDDGTGQALEALKEPSRVELFTDSEYLQRGITEWLPGWKAKNWKRKGGTLANVDLWQALDAALRRHEVSWHWVRGHAGSRENQRADYLARKAIPR